MSFRQNTVKSAYETETADRSAVSRGFLPVCREDMEELGIAQLDFVYVIGDAYVDHPSFGPAIISRVLDARSCRRADIRSASFPSRISEMQTASRCWANRSLDFWYRPEIWIPW